MKFWLNAQLEQGDNFLCSNCHTLLIFPDVCLVEVQFIQGSQPHPDEPHPDPTVRKLCKACAELNFISGKLV
jgi:hypothetical protein